jgi:hypothetical protein
MPRQGAGVPLRGGFLESSRQSRRGGSNLALLGPRSGVKEKEMVMCPIPTSSGIFPAQG